MSKWFRWYEGTCEDGKFRLVARNAGVTVATVMGVWAALLEDAAHPEHRGKCGRGKGFYCAILDVPEEEMDTILGYMDDADLLSIEHDEISITKWKQRQFETDAIDGTNAERQQRFRDNKKANGNVTERNGNVTALKRPDTDTDTDKKDTCAVARATRPNPDFEIFKKSFPRRQGSNPWKPAELLFEKAVKRGTPPETINRAAEAYGAECRRNGITDTDKVAQAQTWLRQERYSDYLQASGAPIAPVVNLRGHFV